MRIALASDLHLEFDTIHLTNEQGVDLLILSGDILVAEALNSKTNPAHWSVHRERFQDFLIMVSDNFPQVVYVMGNHEHYQGDFRDTLTIIRASIEEMGIKNITVLEKETMELDGHLIYGGTLWSDFNKEDPMSIMKCRGYMNDYAVISDRLGLVIPSAYGAYGYGSPTVAKLQPETTLREHKASLIKIREAADLGKPTIIVGHHSPSFRSVHPSFKHEVRVNGAYHSDLEHIMEDYDNIVLWTHGHTHFPFDYKVNSTRVVCNPRGYFGHEEVANNYKLKIIEL